MQVKKIYDFVNSNVVVMPLFLYKNKEKLKLDDSSFIFLMYLNSMDGKILFNPNKYSEDLGIDLSIVLNIITKLSDIKLIEITASKNESGIMEEVLSLDLFHHRIVQMLIEQEDVKESSNIYDKIQEEFGRVLTPIEYEIIGAWLESGYSEELIHEALKEAIYNGVSNLRYIDKILYEWNKKGFKSKVDVDKSRVNWKNRDKEKDVPKREKKEVFDYNWLEDDQDE